MTEEAIRDLLREMAPELVVEPLRPSATGVEKAVWHVGRHHVLRVPRTDGAAERMAVERRVLERIAGRCTLPTPEVVAVEAERGVDLCRKAPGEPLDWRQWPGLGEARKRALLRPFGEFVASLHEALPVEEARALGVRELVWPPAQKLADDLTGRTRTPGQAALLEVALAAAPALHAAPGELVLLHHDLSHHNIGFDPDTGAITGVFDFGEALLGEPVRDLRYDPGLELGDDSAVRAYEEARGVSLSRDRQRAWHAWSALSNLAWSLANEDAELQAMRFGWVDAVAAWDLSFFEAL